MKSSVIIFSFFLLTISVSAQQQFVDVAPSGKQNYLPVQGGAIAMTIDWSTSLDSLIARLNGDWQFEETDKAYWIGYTKDMFSIAARNDTAIPKLINFIANNSNEHAKIGAVYCLHLIGINASIAGRYYEKFVNVKTRIALLSLLKYDELQPTIMKLLIRDPWMSDVPKLFAEMNNSASDCWAICNGLLRYNLKDLPIHQAIPDTIEKISVLITYTDDRTVGRNYDFEGQIHELLDSLNNLHNNYIFIEDRLLKSQLLGNARYNLGTSTIDNSYTEVNIGKFLYQITDVDYIEAGNRIQYYIDNGKTFICSSLTAKNRLLGWWANQSTENKKVFDQNISVQRKR